MGMGGGGSRATIATGEDLIIVLPGFEKNLNSLVYVGYRDGVGEPFYFREVILDKILVIHL